MENLITCKGNNIYAIVGRDEIQTLDMEFNHLEEFPKELCFISLSDPNKYFIKTNNYFKDELKLKFWDVEEDFNDYKIITDSQAKQIYDFIIKNKDSEFLINCEAGVSRSAGVGLAIEYLLRDFELYPKWEHFPSKVLQHWRYYPNMTVFSMIVSHY